MKIKTLIIGVFLAVNTVNSAEMPGNLEEVSQMYLKQMPTLTEIKAQKVYGVVTVLIPLSVLLLPHYTLYGSNLIEEVTRGYDTISEGSRFVDNFTTASRMLISSSIILATVLTSLIPFHFFSKVAEKTEIRQRIIQETSILGSVKNLIKRRLPA